MEEIVSTPVLYSCSLYRGGRRRVRGGVRIRGEGKECQGVGITVENQGWEGLGWVGFNTTYLDLSNSQPAVLPLSFILIPHPTVLPISPEVFPFRCVLRVLPHLPLFWFALTHPCHGACPSHLPSHQSSCYCFLGHLLRRDVVVK